MLTDDEKARLRAEEIYRHQIQSELSKDKKPNRIWQLVNSSIFLWFVSTIAVGAITYIWTSHQNRLATERAILQKQMQSISERDEKIERLNLEIEGRLSQFIVDVEHMVKKPYDKPLTLKSPYTLADIRKRWDSMKLPPRLNQTPSNVYADFADRGIVSLIIELDKLEQERREATGRSRDESAGANNKANDRDRDLGGIVVDIQDDIIFDNKTKNEFLPVYREFNKRIMRWNSFFPYMDCGPEFPFC